MDNILENLANFHKWEQIPEANSFVFNNPSTKKTLFTIHLEIFYDLNTGNYPIPEWRVTNQYGIASKLFASIPECIEWCTKDIAKMPDREITSLMDWVYDSEKDEYLWPFTKNRSNCLIIKPCRTIIRINANEVIKYEYILFCNDKKIYKNVDIKEVLRLSKIIYDKEKDSYYINVDIIED